MPTDRWPVDFRYISKRLVRQMVDQDAATRTRWRSIGIPTPWGTLGLHREPIDRGNLFALCKEATGAVTDLTSTVSHSWGTYIRGELDLKMGVMEVLRGWKDHSHVEIAAMKAVLTDPEVGSIFIGLFGSASNYVGRNPVSDDLGEIPSDVDGLYGILERTREPRDPEISDFELDRDLGHSLASRTDGAVRLLGDRFRGFRDGRYDVLLQNFCTVELTEPYDLVILGAPVWVATPEPQRCSPDA